MQDISFSVVYFDQQLGVFMCKNAENDYFDQLLECAAPKRRSKYTTIMLVICIMQDGSRVTCHVVEVLVDV